MIQELFEQKEQRDIWEELLSNVKEDVSTAIEQVRSSERIRKVVLKKYDKWLLQNLRQVQSL